ncbi:AI-2E family transporter [soil metagenome]
MTLQVGAAIAWRLVAVAAAVAIIAWFLGQISVAVLPLVLAVILAAIFVPPARWLERHGLRPALATLTVLAAALLMVAGVLALVVPRFLAQLEPLRTRLTASTDQLSERFGLPAFDGGDLQGRVIELAREHVGQLLSGAGLLLELLAGVLLTIVLLFFFVKDRDRISGWLLGQLPDERRDTVHAALTAGWATLGGYFRGLVLIAAVDAIGIGIGLAIIGVPLVLSLMVLTFLGALFPVVGTFAAGVVAVLVAFVSGGLTDAVLAFAVILAVQQLEGHVLHPVIMRRTIHLHPVVILFSLTAGAVLAGIAGAFLGVPFVAVAAAMVGEIRARRQLRDA